VIPIVDKDALRKLHADAAGTDDARTLAARTFDSRKYREFARGLSKDFPWSKRCGPRVGGFVEGIPELVRSRLVDGWQGGWDRSEVPPRGGRADLKHRSIILKSIEQTLTSN
jgi:hypothetical protein